MSNLTCLQCERYKSEWCIKCISWKAFIDGTIDVPSLKFSKFKQAYLTPEQYKERTGKKWNGAVWYKYEYKGKWSNWLATTYKWVDDNPFMKDKEVFILATSPEPPPADFIPEATNE